MRRKRVKRGEVYGHDCFLQIFDEFSQERRVWVQKEAVAGPLVELRGRSFQGQVRENFLFTERLVAVRGTIKRIGMWIGSLA